MIKAVNRRPQILVVDSDARHADALSRQLRASGYSVIGVASAQDARSLVTSDTAIDLALIDLDVTSQDSLKLVAFIRASGDVPVLAMSVHDDEPRKVRALDDGADDYVVKPAVGEEFRARVRAAIRRGALGTVATTAQPEDRCTEYPGGVQIDVVARTVSHRGRDVPLTKTEWALLSQFVERPGILQTHEDLLREVWGVGFEGDSHYVRVYVASLRRKLGENARQPSLIATQQGLGYRWIAQPVEVRQ